MQPTAALILHIIKFLIYTLCFRGPTHNSLVLNSRGIKTNARRAPGAPSPAWVNSPCPGWGWWGDRRGSRGTPGSPPGRGWGAGRPWVPGPAPQDAITQHCSREKWWGQPHSLLGLVHARARSHTHTNHKHTARTPHSHPGGRRRHSLGRHLPVGGGLQTGRDESRNYGLQTLESPGGPGPLLPPPTRPPLLGAGPGTHQRAKRIRRPRGEVGGAESAWGPFAPRPGDRRPSVRSRARYRRAEIVGDPRGARASGLVRSRGGVEGLVSHPPPRGWPPCPLKGKPLSGDRYHRAQLTAPGPGQSTP